MHLSDQHVRWFRLRRSGLDAPFATPEDVTRALAGVQAQILPAAGLALWNRTNRLTYVAFDDLLHQRRSLVKLWGQRGTLHLYASHEWPLLHAALAIQRTWWGRQVERNGGDADDYQATILRVAALLRERGTLGRRDLRAAEFGLEEELFSGWGGIFADLVRQGYACHAGQSAGEGRFAHREHWLPDLDWTPPPAETANIELTRRYLKTYGPATIQDVAYWRGAKVGNVRRWIAALGDEVAELDLNGRSLLVLRADLEALAAPPPARKAWPVRLLGRFDPLLLGIKDKSWLIDEPFYKRVWRPAGHIEGTILEYGRIAGVWRYDRAARGLSVTVTPFAPLSRHVWAAVEQQAEGIARFFGVKLEQMVANP